MCVCVDHEHEDGFFGASDICGGCGECCSKCGDIFGRKCPHWFPKIETCYICGGEGEHNWEVHCAELNA